MKKLNLFLTTLLMTATLGTITYAGEWKQDSSGWWYQNNDGTYPINSWQNIDGKDYFFSGNGYMLVNTTTPDGKQVGTDGVLMQIPLFEFSTDKWHVKYTKHEVSTDYEGNSCIIVYYDYTNKTSEPTSPMAAWIGLEAYQNGVECNGAVIASSTKNQSIENEYKKIMPGITANVASSFSISDKSPITLIVNDPLAWDENAKSVTVTLNIE